jgi:hypothetical protein
VWLLKVSRRFIGSNGQGQKISQAKIQQEVFFFFWHTGGGVQLGPLGTAATDWPILPAPGDYDDGEFC